MSEQQPAPSGAGLTMEELQVGLELWEPHMEKYVAFVNPTDSKVLEHRFLRHPAIDIRAHREVPRFQLFVWLKCDVPDGLMEMSEIVNLPKDVQRPMVDASDDWRPNCPRCSEARIDHDVQYYPKSRQLVCRTCGYSGTVAR